MRPLKLLLDTNVVVDYINHRDPHFNSARLLMIVGRVGDFDLWIASSQVTDLIYILSDGGKPSLIPGVVESLRSLRSIVRVLPVGEADIDRMLAEAWEDPEDGLLVELAVKMQATAIISRDEDFPHTDLIPVYDCEEFFAWLESEHGITYTEADI